ncbi:MAG: DMT family transporter [Candidatus Aenigmarchaeota archaeon]|nr:DMT family transporter [Candidatus Aenigmarchaeota archaeon]
MEDTTLAILFGLISMLGYGLSNGLTKVPLLKIGNIKTVFYRGIFANILLLITTLFYLPKINFSLNYILIAFLISTIAYLSIIAFYKALKIGKIGLVSPVANSSVIFTILFSIIFFSESLSAIQAFSVLLIISGITLISINFSDLKNSHFLKTSSGIPHALITCLLWGLMYFLFKIPVMVIGPILTTFIIECGILLYSGIHLKISKTSFDIPNPVILTYIFFVAFFGVIGTLFFNLGIKIYDVSIIAALTFSSPIVVALYGRFIYKEKLTLSQWLAILLILTGIICISYF